MSHSRNEETELNKDIWPTLYFQTVAKCRCTIATGVLVHTVAWLSDKISCAPSMDAFRSATNGSEYELWSLWCVFTESLQWWAQNGEKDKVNVNFFFGFMVSVPILQQRQISAFFVCLGSDYFVSSFSLRCNSTKSHELIVLKIFGVLYCSHPERLRHRYKVAFTGYGALGRSRFQAVPWYPGASLAIIFNRSIFWNCFNRSERPDVF